MSDIVIGRKVVITIEDPDPREYPLLVRPLGRAHQGVRTAWEARTSLLKEAEAWERTRVRLTERLKTHDAEITENRQLIELSESGREALITRQGELRDQRAETVRELKACEDARPDIEALNDAGETAAEAEFDACVRGETETLRTLVAEGYMSWFFLMDVIRKKAAEAEKKPDA